ncbi:rod shape-determining protein MreD [Streptomyces sp. MST-110588]|uniref:rod shape-determining protein MreD n=1 Tax=Streptomyces sp. MST-110588 TaxID=2833628 RepID=UPI001F5C71FC|nr:rod shape-determining protein MreD [Streptomyces sp. MST-110588]UNO42013.1 rod shape-determining protein MreD [Streptomyces sp. MST-110588]
MRINRILLSTALVLVALVVQVSVLARLQLPGAVPDLLLLVVLGLALAYGHVGGALVGFGAGLLADLAPPSDHAIGRYALVLCVIGYLAGLTRPENGHHRSVAVPLMVVIGSAIGSTLLYAVVGSLVGDTAARHVGLAGLLFSATLYDLLLAPFAVPVVMALARRSENDPLAADGAAQKGGPSKGRDGAYGWISPGKGLKASRTIRTSKVARIGGQRGGLLGKSARNKAGRIKGVKRL